MADDETTVDNVSNEDKELADAARAKAGGGAKLARLLGHSSRQAVSEWGRIRPIPKHLRPRLHEFVFGAAPPRRLSPAEMRALFEQWVHDLGPENVVEFDLWAGMEAGFNNGIEREAERRRLRKMAEDDAARRRPPPRARPAQDDKDQRA